MGALPNFPPMAMKHGVRAAAVRQPALVNHAPAGHGPSGIDRAHDHG